MRRRTWLKSLGAVMCIWLAGCQLDYIAHVVCGELDMLGGLVPVSEALQDERLTDAERTKLAMTQDVRQYGIDHIGLYAGDSYTIFDMNGVEPAAYILTASYKESLTSYLWFYPILGPMAVKGFFDQEFATREAQQLIDMDLDVFLGRADGFSTLGFLPDPVRQSNLQLDEIELAELILHEMLHSTVYRADDLDFDESLATFVGRRAAQAWFEDTYGVDSDAAKAARIRFADKAIVDEYVIATYAHMKDYYESAAERGESREQIIANREAAFEETRSRWATDYLPRIVDQETWQGVGETTLNNASLAVSIRYQGSISDFAGVLDKLGGDFPAAIEVYKESLSAPDSREFIQEWVRQH